MGRQQEPEVHSAQIAIMAMEPTDHIVERLVRRIYLRKVDPGLLRDIPRPRMNIRIIENGRTAVCGAEVMDHCDIDHLRVVRLYLEVLDFYTGCFVIVEIDKEDYKSPIPRYTVHASREPDEIRALLLPQQPAN